MQKGVIMMDIRDRILKGKLIEEINRDPEYSEVLGIHDCTKFRGSPVQPQSRDNKEDDTPSVSTSSEHTES